MFFFQILNFNYFSTSHGKMFPSYLANVSLFKVLFHFVFLILSFKLFAFLILPSSDGIHTMNEKEGNDFGHNVTFLSSSFIVFLK